MMIIANWLTTVTGIILCIGQVLPPSEPGRLPHSEAGSIVSVVQDSSDFGTMPPELGQYYHYINLAARAIYRNDFAEASVLYDTAFLHKTNPFYVDLANYVRVNYKCGQQTKNDSAIYRLIVGKHIDSTSLYLHIPKHWFDADNRKLIHKLSRKTNTKTDIRSKIENPLRDIWASDQGVREYDKIPTTG